MDAPVKLSVRELFDAEAAQGTFQRLVDAINAQAAAVERLTRRVATLETTQRHAVAAQQHALQQADAIVAQIETLQDTQARTEAARRVQQSRVDELVLVVSRDSTLLENVAGELKSLQQATDTMRESMRRETAPMELVVRLQEDQYAVHDRIAAVETRVDGKLDKSEMSRLDGVVATIQAFAPTAKRLSTRCERIEETYATMKSRLDDESERTSRVSQALDQLHVDLAHKLDQATWQEFTETTFKAALYQLQKDAKGSAAVVNELVHRGVSLETSYRTLSSKVTSVSTAIADGLDTIRIHMKNELEKKLDRKAIDESIQEIRQELSCKAWRKDTNALHDELEQLLTRFEEVLQQVALSTRFLDWYATRGESYERNLNVVDNQLERLAFASAPQLRQPYGDQVRF